MCYQTICFCHNCDVDVHFFGSADLNLLGDVDIYLFGGVDVYILVNIDVDLCVSTYAYLLGNATYTYLAVQMYRCTLTWRCGHTQLLGGADVHLLGSVDVHLLGGVNVHLLGGANVH